MTCGHKISPRTRSSACRGQRGAGLLEVLIASAVMAPLILAAALGMLTGIRASATAATSQRIGVALTTATENVKAMPYLRCGTPEEYRSSHERWLGEHPPTIVEGQRVPEPQFVEVTYWDERSASYTSACTDDGGAQRITLAVVVDGRTGEADIVTRDPAPGRALEQRR